MWQRFLMFWGIVTIVIGIFTIFLSLTPQLWVNISWDISACSLGIAIAALGFCFLALSRR